MKAKAKLLTAKGVNARELASVRAQERMALREKRAGESNKRSDRKAAVKEKIRSKPSTAERTKLENDYDMYQARHGLSDPETQAKARKTMAAQQRFHKRRGDDGKRSK